MSDQFVDISLIISFPYTVWSMPGGFTSGGREGYQTVDDEPFIRNTSRPAAPPHRMPAPSTTEPTAPGAYQSVV